MSSTQQASRYEELIENLSCYSWEENKAYLGIEENVWFSDAGKMYVRDTESRNVEHDQELMYLEGRFNPEKLAEGEKIDQIVERILGN